MNAPDRFFLPDINARADLRQLASDKVGVKDLRYPLALLAHYQETPGLDLDRLALPGAGVALWRYFDENLLAGLFRVWSPRPWGLQ